MVATVALVAMVAAAWEAGRPGCNARPARARQHHTAGSKCSDALAGTACYRWLRDSSSPRSCHASRRLSQSCSSPEDHCNGKQSTSTNLAWLAPLEAAGAAVVDWAVAGEAEAMVAAVMEMVVAALPVPSR